MDYIHGLLIAEDDLNDVENEEEEATAAVLTDQTPISAASHEVGPSAGPSIPWCKRRVCQIMPQEIENKCCGQWKCMTTHTRFHKLS